MQPLIMSYRPDAADAALIAAWAAERWRSDR